MTSITASDLRPSDVIVETLLDGDVTVVEVRRPAGDDFVYVDLRLVDGTIEEDVPFGSAAWLRVRRAA